MKDPTEIVLWILEVVDSEVTEDGLLHERCRWKVAEKNISLGSFKEPNEKIKAVKYAERGVDFKDLFKRL